MLNRIFMHTWPLYWMKNNAVWQKSDLLMILVQLAFTSHFIIFVNMAYLVPSKLV